MPPLDGHNHFIVTPRMCWNATPISITDLPQCGPCRMQASRYDMSKRLLILVVAYQVYLVIAVAFAEYTHMRLVLSSVDTPFWFWFAIA